MLRSGSHHRFNPGFSASGPPKTLDAFGQEPRSFGTPPERWLSRTSADPSIQRDLVRMLAAGDLSGLADPVRLTPALAHLLNMSAPDTPADVRQRAAQALARLGAITPLVDFLDRSAEPGDLAARAEERTVVDMAASLVPVEQPRARAALVKAALHWRVRGAVARLAGWPGPEVIPGLVAGLYHDDTRAAAESALAGRGRAAVPILWEVVSRAPWADHDGAHTRARRSAAALLARLELSPRQLRALGRFTDDPDVEVSAQACLAVLRDGEGAATHARARLAAILPWLSLKVRRDAASCLRETAETSPV